MKGNQRQLPVYAFGWLSFGLEHPCLRVALIEIQHGGGIPAGAAELDETCSILERRPPMKNVLRVIVQSEASVRRPEREHAALQHREEAKLLSLLFFGGEGGLTARPR